MDEKTRSGSFEWGASIGVGALNEGWSVISKETRKKYALLKSKQKMSSLNERRLCVPAFKNLRRLLLANGTWHSHILRHYSLWQENGYLFLQTELCEKGDLGRLFDQKAERRLLVENDIWEVIKHILPTIHFIHSRGILHMDIKPANIYLTNDDIMKLGDFGTSVKRSYWKTECDMHEGDAGYLAVEVLRDHYLSPAADIFSFGMTLHRLVTGYCVPTGSLTTKESFLKNPRFRLSSQLAQVILSMCHPNHEERARCDQLMSSLGLQQPFFEDILSYRSRPKKISEFYDWSPVLSSSSSSSSSSPSAFSLSDSSPQTRPRKISLSSPKTPTEPRKQRRSIARHLGSFRDL